MTEWRPYLRVQPRTWWAQSPYRAYTIRELCGVALALYAAILLAGLICLARGPEWYDGYRRVMASSWFLLIHLLLLGAALWHSWTWFQILPKTMPRLVWRGKHVRQAAIASAALLLAVLCSGLVLVTVILVGSRS